MFSWIISAVLGAIVAFVVSAYMLSLGIALAPIIFMGAVLFGYTASVVLLLLDER